MASKTLIIAGVVVLTLGVAGLAILTLRPNSQPPIPINTTPAPPPIQSSDPCKDFETLAYLKYPVPCRTAVAFALEQAPGTVRNVSIGNVRTSIPTSSGGIERRSVDMWLIDIELYSPYFDETFGGREINVMQVGIRTEENNIIYKKILQ